MATNPLELECLTVQPVLHAVFMASSLCTVWPYPITLSIFPTISLPLPLSLPPPLLRTLTSIYPFSLSSPATLLQATPPPLPPRLPPSTPISQPACATPGLPRLVPYLSLTSSLSTVPHLSLLIPFLLSGEL